MVFYAPCEESDRLHISLTKTSPVGMNTPIEGVSFIENIVPIPTEHFGIVLDHLHSYDGTSFIEILLLTDDQNRNILTKKTFNQGHAGLGGTGRARAAERERPTSGVWFQDGTTHELPFRFDVTGTPIHLTSEQIATLLTFEEPMRGIANQGLNGDDCRCPMKSPFFLVPCSPRPFDRIIWSPPRPLTPPNGEE